MIKNEYCFGMNSDIKVFDKTDWRPKYFVSEDIIIIQGIQKEISDIPSDYKFIPINLHWYENVPQYPQIHNRNL